jgi:hypothetical protein
MADEKRDGGTPTPVTEDEGHPLEGHTAARAERVSGRAAEAAADRPAPHGTPHEVTGSPVRNPKDLEGDGSPGTSNEATKKLPP